MSRLTTRSATASTITITPLLGIPEVHEGDELADVVDAGLTSSGFRLEDGDILVVSSKIASKSLGLVTHDPDKDRVVAAETEYVVAERALEGHIARIVRAKAGPIIAAAGVDGSNTGDRGGWLLLPHDPDAVCERLQDELRRRHEVRVGIVLSDTSGRPWRIGQVDFALGVHGVRATDDLRGGSDADGRRLDVTTRALADEVASAADLAKGKVHAVPAAVIRGLAAFVPVADDPAAPRGRDLVRSGPDDWFGYGRVEAVRAALGVEPGTADADAVGIPPASRHDSTRLEAVGRAVRTALHEVDSGTADIGQVSVTLGAATTFELGRLTARLEAALWCEWLEGIPEEPSADGLCVVVAVSGTRGRHPHHPPR
jgi:coenzyme F420-0:L-glutamate ligase/coenzyme F420-1:gamma-L-glutamate ligase